MLPQRHLAHVRIPDLPVQVERPRVGPGALLIASAIDPGTLLACSPEAAAIGLGPGSSRYTAQQLLPEATLIDADEHAYHAAHTAIQTALQTFTPEIETLGLGEWVMELRGVGMLEREGAGAQGRGSAGAREREGAGARERRDAGAQEPGSAGVRERIPPSKETRQTRTAFAQPARVDVEGVRGWSANPTFKQASLFERAPAAQPRLLVEEAPAQTSAQVETPTKPARARTQARRTGAPTTQTLDDLAQAILAAVQSASGLQVQIGVASNRFTAEQAAKNVERGAESVERTRSAELRNRGHSALNNTHATHHAPHSAFLTVSSGEEARFLAPLSIDVLPHLPGEARRRLHLLDLHTLGDLAALRKPAVLRQFGGDFAGLHELACGRDPRPVRVDAPPLRIVRSLLLPDLEERGLILNALGRLARQVGRALQLSGHHAEALRLTLTLDDGQRLEIGAAVKPPSSDETRLMRLAAQLLGRLDVPAPVVSAAVSAYPLRSWHLGYYQRALREAGVVSEQQNRLEDALNIVARRFGEAMVRVAALFGPPLPLPIEVELDGRGQPVRFRLGGRGYAVLTIDEAWREERRWWDRPIRRDYFRVQVGDGSPRTLYQDLDRMTWHLDRAWPR